MDESELYRFARYFYFFGAYDGIKATQNDFDEKFQMYKEQFLKEERELGQSKEE